MTRLKKSIIPLITYKYMTLQWLHTTLLILLYLIMQNACDIWTGCFDSPDSLTSSVVGAVQRKVLESDPLVTLRFFFCAIVVPNVQYLSRNNVHKYEYGTKPQLCPHACTRYRRTINKSINYHPETVKKLSSTADCSFISSLAVDGFTMHRMECYFEH